MLSDVRAPRPQPWPEPWALCGDCSPGTPKQCPPPVAAPMHPHSPRASPACALGPPSRLSPGWQSPEGLANSLVQISILLLRQLMPRKAVWHLPAPAPLLLPGIALARCLLPAARSACQAGPPRLRPCGSSALPVTWSIVGVQRNGHRQGPRPTPQCSGPGRRKCSQPPLEALGVLESSGVPLMGPNSLLACRAHGSVDCRDSMGPVVLATLGWGRS